MASGGPRLRSWLSRKRPPARESPAPAGGAPIVFAFQERLQALEREIDGASTAATRPDLRDRLEEAADELLDPGELAQTIFRLRGDAERRLEPAVSESLERLLAFLYRRWFRVTVHGIERVPASGPALLVAEAPAGLVAYEPAMLRMALRLDHPSPREMRTVLTAALRRRRLAAQLLTRLGGIPARRPLVARELENGGVLAVFAAAAEPKRRAAGRAFAREIFLDAAIAAGAAIIPVATSGAVEAHPVLGTIATPNRLFGLPELPITPTFPWLGLLGLVPLPTRWRIRFGEPLNVEGSSTKAATTKDFAEEIRDRLRSLQEGERPERRRPG